MLYKKSKEESLSAQLFKNPTSEYRAAPFWAWNCELEKEELLRQIEVLKQMGMGGFHMHSRDGMATPYLSDEFMELISACVKKAKDEGMKAYLYDEDRYPSGSAGGLLTKNVRYAKRFVVFTAEKQESVSLDKAIETGAPYFIGAYDVSLNENGEIKNYTFTEKEQDAVGTMWYAYIMTNPAVGWFNNQRYVDTLSKEAIDEFIKLTHERYKEVVGEDFDETIPSIFSDEPQFEEKTTLDFAESKNSVRLPWTLDFEDSYREKYGYSITEKLPELIWELPNSEVSEARYNYHDHITERFTKAFADNCGIWCENNGIALTGHMLFEDGLHVQTAHIGEAMRAYTHFAIPGIDMLCNEINYVTAKQAQSNVHQYGKEGMMSELYGVTNWDFDFRGHKFQGDWQAALGVTLRVPHLSWVSMKGMAKRDYPASINYQSPWYKEYGYVENHFARLNTALTRGKPIVKIGVIHPVESYWLHYGPKENTAEVRKMLDTQFNDLTKWLLTGLLDFDYICESTLPMQLEGISDTLKVGEMEYSSIVLAGCETLRSSTYEILEKFQKNGGNIIFLGEAPEFEDAKKSERGKKLFEKCRQIEFKNYSLTDSLKDERLIDIRESDGTRSENMIYQYREDKDCRWLFVTRLFPEKESENVTKRKDKKIIVNGEFTPEIYDTASGEIKKINFEIIGKKTYIYYGFYALDSLLLKLNPKTVSSYFAKDEKFKVLAEKRFFEKVNYEREEDNVLLLDMATYKIDSGEFSKEPEDVIRINSICKNALGLINNGTQPWVFEAKKAENNVTLKYRFESEIDFEGAFLATEDAKVCKIIFNGKFVQNEILGYFTDKAIEKIPLPKIIKGENILEITYPLGLRGSLENCFILGSFDVRCEGTTKTIIPESKKIAFGDITNLGMPFYGGNLTYKTEFETPCDCEADIHAGVYKGSLIKAKLDGEDIGVIAYSPYDINCKNIKKGKHTLELTLFGNRYNSFGPLHYTDTKLNWFGENAWSQFQADPTTKYKTWKYEYSLKPSGILASPVIVFKTLEN